jgi:beta-glucosidase-like glycosyl hydrolase
VVRGIQGEKLGSTESVIACAKHFVADGGTDKGVDQGDAKISEQELRAIHLPGYVAAVKAGVGSIMASYSSWNGQRLHGQKFLLTDVLKGELGFQGFVVSDYDGIKNMSTSFRENVANAINAGVDMAMIGNDYQPVHPHREVAGELEPHPDVAHRRRRSPHPAGEGRGRAVGASHGRPRSGVGRLARPSIGPSRAMPFARAWWCSRTTRTCCP